MPYALRFYLYLIVAGVVVTVSWLGGKIRARYQIQNLMGKFRQQKCAYSLIGIQTIARLVG